MAPGPAATRIRGGGVTEHEALEDVLVTLRTLDKAERRRTGIPLTLDGTREFGAWVGQIDHYATRLETELVELGRPSHAMLDRLGAWVVATKLALARAEAMDVVNAR